MWKLPLKCTKDTWGNVTPTTAKPGWDSPCRNYLPILFLQDALKIRYRAITSSCYCIGGWWAWIGTLVLASTQGCRQPLQVSMWRPERKVWGRLPNSGILYSWASPRLELAWIRISWDTVRPLWFDAVVTQWWAVTNSWRNFSHDTRQLGDNKLRSWAAYHYSYLLFLSRLTLT